VTLRDRLMLLTALFAALVVATFGAFAYATARGAVEAQLETVLLADLQRVSALLDQPTVGASFAATNLEVIVQFLTGDGTLLLWWGDDAPLPATDSPTFVTLGARQYLVAEAPWLAVGGTIRLGHDVTAALAARDQMLRTLVSGGATAVALAALLALLVVRGTLRPLDDLARQTRAIDPAVPRAIHYEGPDDEVGAVARALNGAVTAIAERQERERRFLLEVAHELAAPLTLVDYHLDGVRRGTLGPGSLGVAAEAARELLRTSQDLFAIARGDVERRLDVSVVDVVAVATKVASEYPGVTLDAADPVEVAGDPERLAQIVRNIVRNAVQASGGPHGVLVAVRSEGEEAVLEVRDRGPGMTAETLAHAFEHGFSRGGGVGVGLSVARSLTERHGGSVRILESSSGGTTMEVRLPSLAAQLEPAPSVSPVSGS
jgi:two-component system, OmpR family, sensor kinase